MVKRREEGSKSMLISQVPIELRKQFRTICAAKDWRLREPLLYFINKFVETNGAIYEKSIKRTTD